LVSDLNDRHGKNHSQTKALPVIEQVATKVPVSAERPRVLEVLEATGAGTASYISDLLLNINTEAFDVSFAYSPLRSDERFGSALQQIARRGIAIYEIPMQRNIRPVEDTKSLWRLYRLIKARQFHIVHGHSSKAGFLARLAAKLANTRIITVYSPHAISILVSPHYWYLERFAGLFTNMVLGVSRSEVEELEKYHLVPRCKLGYVTAGIDLSAYVGSFPGGELRRRMGLSASTILIGTAGRITAQKDPATFLKAAAELLERGVRAHFAWAGDGELKSASERLAVNLGINQHVTFLGNFPDLRGFLDAVDIFALTSRYESFGYVTCEAMAMRKPVVATNVSGSNELVLDGVTGYLVEVADAVGIAAAIHRLVTNGELRRRLGEAGHARAWRLYDLKRMIRDVEQVYRDLFGRFTVRDDSESATVTALQPTRS
jgi:glycosyltransferase involved in cell wall biosynthesis